MQKLDKLIEATFDLHMTGVDRFAGEQIQTLEDLLPEILKTFHATQELLKDLASMEREAHFQDDNPRVVDKLWREKRDAAISKFNKSME